MSALEGYNATIVAYGPTSTGKTYTMEGGLKAMMEAGNLNGWGKSWRNPWFFSANIGVYPDVPLKQFLENHNVEKRATC